MAGERFQALQNALLQAFPNEDALRQLLIPMDLKLPVITTGRSLAVMTLDVIEHIEAHGRLEELVASACQQRPHNADFERIVQQFWPSLQRRGSVPRPAEPSRRCDGALSENEWNHLISFIRERKLTPVIGPGIARGVLPEHVQLAAEWADRWQYPFADRADLTRVSQFLALTEYRLLPHEQIQQRYSSARTPDFGRSDEPHALLADLNLPLYLTTNYDDLMLRALKSRRLEPTYAFPCWNQSLKEQAAQDALPVDTARGPLVYHLFGHHAVPESMVLTEDEHFDFLTAVADPRLLPPVVKKAIGGTSLLFIGYGVLDFGFRVLVRALLKSITAPNKRLGVAVQLPPENLSDSQREQVEKYLEGFLNDAGTLRFRVFWGNTDEFTRNLRDRWEEQRHHAPVV